MSARDGGAAILMCAPRHFRVDYVINPWMAGNVHRASPQRAAAQWQALYHLIRSQCTIDLIEPDTACPDMVFTANAGLVVGDIAVPSRFFHAERRAEEKHFTRWFADHHYRVHTLAGDLPFEGAGDALLDRAGPWLWAAYGSRTDLRSHTLLAHICGIEVISLRLVDRRFYHLDTCLCPLAGGSLLYYPPAFDAASLRIIERRVSAARRIEVSEADALNFVCNAVELNNTLIVHRAGAALHDELAAHGFQTIETPLDEFLKAGGSAKCLTLKLNEQPARGPVLATPAVVPAVSGLSRMVELEGQLLDDGILSAALDVVTGGGGAFQVAKFDLGQSRHLPSHAEIEVTAPSAASLSKILAQLVELGGRPQAPGEPLLAPAAKLQSVVQDGVAPDAFYATTIFPTSIRLETRWVDVIGQRMDAVIVVSGTGDTEAARCVLLRDLHRGDNVVVGIEGVRVVRAGNAPGAVFNATAPAGDFAFMGAGVSSERSVELAVDDLAWQLHRLREQGHKAVVVAGPVVIHAGGGPHLAHMVRGGFVSALLAGNALAVHDIEAALYGTSLGVDLHHGGEVEGGHRNHLRAINTIRRCGGIRAAVEARVLTSGIFCECVRREVPFSLAGSIRDDGPLPETQMDLIAAQADYARLLKGSHLTLLLSTMLHAIGAGNMTPAGVRLVCVDINPAVVTKLADRGSLESTGIVTDVGLFLNLLGRKLDSLG